MQAKFPGVCATCGGHFAQGDAVMGQPPKHRGRGRWRMYHTGCAKPKRGRTERTPEQKVALQAWLPEADRALVLEVYRRQVPALARERTDGAPRETAETREFDAELDQLMLDPAA